MDCKIPVEVRWDGEVIKDMVSRFGFEQTIAALNSNPHKFDDAYIREVLQKLLDL